MRTESVNEFRQWVRTPLGKEIMGVLHSHIPWGYPRRGEMVNETQTSVELGRTQGYLDCLNLLKSLAQHPKEPLPEMEADYGAVKEESDPQ